MTPKKYFISSNHLLVTHLYQRYTRTLLMALCRQLPTREDAEDVLLEVFQAAMESERLPMLE